MAKQNTVQRVEEIITPYAKELGLEIWDVRFAKEGSDWYLRVFIDKDGGVSIDDCVDLPCGNKTARRGRPDKPKLYARGQLARSRKRTDKGQPF